MKEATGELNMTVIVVVAAGLILAFFMFLWPQIRNRINDSSLINCPTGTHEVDGRCVED